MTLVRALNGGRGHRTLLLLHGLGATSDTWLPLARLLDPRWGVRWVAPDLPGHGGSPPAPTYSFASLAAAAASAADVDGDIYVLGHSLGGVVGTELASGRYGIRVAHVLALGVKVEWTVDELARARGLAERPLTWFTDKGEAIDRHLRVSGLTGLVPSDSPIAEAGVVHDDGRWRLALDPAAFAIGAPDMRQLIAAAHAPVKLARGENDHMISEDQMRAIDPDSITLAGLGHNAHVEGPAAVLAAWHSLVMRDS